MSNGFRISDVISASAPEIYEAWLSSDGHTAMTGSEPSAENLTPAMDISPAPRWI